MALGYRGIFFLPYEEDVFSFASLEFEKWIRGKGFSEDNDLKNGQYIRSANCDSVSSSGVIEISNDVSAAIFLLSETKSGRTWNVSLTSVFHKKANLKNFFLVEVDVSVKNGEDPIDLVAPPRFVSNLIDRTLCLDSDVLVTTLPEFVSSNSEVAKMLLEISDNKRRLFINVTSPVAPERMNDLKDIVQKLTSRSVGNSKNYILVGEAFEAFNKIVGRDFGLPFGGNTRTFSPGVDVTVPQQEMRHEYLSQSVLRLALKPSASGFLVDNELQKSFNRSVRTRFVQGDLPNIALQALPKLQVRLAQIRQEIAIREQIASPVLRPVTIETRAADKDSKKKPFSNTNEPLLLLMRDLVAKIVNAGNFLFELTGDLIKSAIDTYVREKNAYEDSLNDNSEALSVALTKHRYTENELFEMQVILENSEQRIRELEFQNKELRYSLYNPETNSVSEKKEWMPNPKNFQELLDRLNVTEENEWSWVGKYIVFTGDAKTTQSLDKHADSIRFRNQTWTFIEVLYDFAAQRASTAENALDVGTYLRTPKGIGRKCDPKNQSTESESVKNRKKFARQRLLPVPLQVDGRGKIEMWDHFKIATSDTISPRLHYFDDTHKTGKIYIGYIGRHLETDSTN
jgi:hypothetical protein